MVPHVSVFKTDIYVIILIWSLGMGSDVVLYRGPTAAVLCSLAQG